MSLDNSVMIAAVTGAVATIVWLVRLEGRMNVHEERHRTLVATIGEMKIEVRASLAEIKHNVDLSMTDLKSDRREIRGELARMTRAIDRINPRGRGGVDEDPERAV